MGLDVMGLYRLARRLKQRGIPWIPGVLSRAIGWLSRAHIPPDVVIGEGTRLGYGSLGVVLHRDTTIGRHCMISQDVTIDAGPEGRGAPRIGNHVRIGTGARVFGNVVIGDFAVIGANAVVLEDVPRATVVAGIPARVLRTDPSLERCARCHLASGVSGRGRGARNSRS